MNRQLESPSLPAPETSSRLEARPRTPLDDAQVDAQALTFEWDGPPADDYMLEVSRDSGFSDVVARVPTGNSTSITVYDLFRPDGTRYFWRVTSSAFGSSTSRSFVATPFQRLSSGATSSARSTTVPAGERVAPRPAQRPLRLDGGTPATAEDIPGLYRKGVTSSQLSMTVVLLMLLSFIASVTVIFLISLGI